MVGLQFQFKYRKGSENHAADALSRVGRLYTITAMSVCQPAWVQEVVNSYQTDTQALELMAQLAVHSPDKKAIHLTTA